MTKEEEIEMLMAGSGFSRAEAEEVYAIEHGEIPGDLIPIDDDGAGE